MNSLSWMIYFADLIGNLKVLCGMVLVFGSVGTLAYTIFQSIENDRVAPGLGKITAGLGLAALIATATSATSPST